MKKIKIKKIVELQSIYCSVKQISSFIYAFKGEIYDNLKNIFLGKLQLTKVFLIHLHSSTLV